MSKRDDGTNRKMTAAEEELILAAIRDRRAWRAYLRTPYDAETGDDYDKSAVVFTAAVRAVVRERGKKRGR